MMKIVANIVIRMAMITMILNYHCRSQACPQETASLILMIALQTLHASKLNSAPSWQRLQAYRHRTTAPQPLLQPKRRRLLVISSQPNTPARNPHNIAIVF